METILCPCGNRLILSNNSLKVVHCSKCSLEFVNIFAGKHGKALRGERKTIETANICNKNKQCEVFT